MKKIIVASLISSIASVSGLFMPVALVQATHACSNAETMESCYHSPYMQNYPRACSPTQTVGSCFGTSDPVGPTPPTQTQTTPPANTTTNPPVQNNPPTQNYQTTNPAGNSSGPSQSASNGSALTTPAVPAVNLGFGSRGNAVIILQARLGVIQTGYFGPLTLAAVKLFQAENGIIQTGYFGPLSRAAMSAQ